MNTPYTISGPNNRVVCYFSNFDSGPKLLKIITKGTTVVRLQTFNPQDDE